MTERSERCVVLAMMAHPDDAEILCGGTLIRLRQLGAEIHIATCTPGDCGSMTEDRWRISARRTEEATRAAARLNATYHCLDERDCFVCYDKTTLAKMYDLFRRISP
ncbi:MAG: PIG-L family deacetylase, partial [Planctomycetia bacterium]|nr:PIG-L family deacetylase [Planctomycetia bacterium]